MFTSNDPDAIRTGLVSAAFYIEDWRWVEANCLQLAKHSDAGVRSTAALCFGHLARIHQQLHLEKVIPVLEELRSSPETVGNAENALGDISIFIDQANIEGFPR